MSSSSTIGAFKSRIQQSGKSLKTDCKNSKNASTNRLEIFASKEKKTVISIKLGGGKKTQIHLN